MECNIVEVEVDREKLTEEFKKAGFTFNEKFVNYEITSNSHPSYCSKVVTATVHDCGSAQIYMDTVDSDWCQKQAKIALEILRKTPFRERR